MTISIQIKFIAVLLISTLNFENVAAQKLNEHYLSIMMIPPSDTSTVLAPEASNVILPIALKSFEASPLSRENIISWTSLSEQNIKEFVIERSVNPSNNWSIIATVRNYGDYPEGTSRTFTDINPNCISYYRLRSIDNDGKENISKTISVERNCLKSTFIKTYPNPTQASLNINFDAAQSGVITLSFIDMLGRVILQKQTNATEGVNDISMDLSGLKNGLYFVTFTDSFNKISQLIEKN